MLTNRTKKELTQLANDMASGYAIVKCNHTLYLPVNFRTLDVDQNLPPEERVWIPLTMPQVLDLAQQTNKPASQALWLWPWLK